MPEDTTIVAPPIETPAPAPAPAKDMPKLSDPFADLKPAPKPAAKPAIAPDKKEAPVAPKDDKSPATAKPEAKAEPKPVAGRKDAITEQRARIDEQNKVIAGITKERDDLKQRMVALEARGGGDTQAMVKMVEELKKKNEDLYGEIAARDYSKHPDFKSKYEKPLKDAAMYAKKIVESLQVTDQEGNLRDAKWETDFAPIYQLPRGAALRQAKSLFGDDVSAITSVMTQYDTLHQLDEAKDVALNDWQKGATEREQTQRAQKLVFDQNVQRAFDLVTQNYIDSDPEFQIKPDDTEASDLWKKSEAIVDRAFVGRDKLAPHELIQLDAAVRLRAINEPVLRAKLAKVQAELDDYKSRLDEQEESVSGKTRKPAAPIAPNADMPWDKELAGALKAAE